MNFITLRTGRTIFAEEKWLKPIVYDNYGIRLDFDHRPSELVKVVDASDLYVNYGKDDLLPAYLISKNKDKANREYLESCKPMDDEWKFRLRNLEWSIYSDKKAETDEKYPEFATLRNRLLEFAGEDVCADFGPEPYKDIIDVLNRGQFWLGKSAKMMKGRDCHCHGNSAELYDLNKDNFDVRICTGFALSDDGMWREHSWLIKHNARSNQIIETTKPRICYYGYVLTKEECEKAVEEWIW